MIDDVVNGCCAMFSELKLVKVMQCCWCTESHCGNSDLFPFSVTQHARIKASLRIKAVHISVRITATQIKHANQFVNSVPGQSAFATCSFSIVTPTPTTALCLVNTEQH